MKVKAHIRLNYVGMKDEWVIEIPDSELEGLDERERFDFISEWVKEEMEQNHFEWGWEEEGESNE